MKRYFILFSLITCLSTSLYGALVAHYEFEDTTNDSTANNYHLTNPDGGAKAYSNTAIRGTRSYDFDNTDNYLELDNQGTFQNDTSGTISFWIKTSTNNDRSFFSMNNAENIEILSDNNTLTSFYDAGMMGADTKDEINADAGIYDDKWHMITVTFNNVDGSEKIYKDGLLVALDTDQNNKFGLGKELYIGGSNGGGGGFLGGMFGGGADTQYTGLMDDLRIYNNELSADEVWNLFNSQISTATVPISPKLYILLTIALLFIGIKQTKA